MYLSLRICLINDGNNLKNFRSILPHRRRAVGVPAYGPPPVAAVPILPRNAAPVLHALRLHDVPALRRRRLAPPDLRNAHDVGLRFIQFGGQLYLRGHSAWENHQVGGRKSNNTNQAEVLCVFRLDSEIYVCHHCIPHLLHAAGGERDDTVHDYDGGCC